MKVFTIGIIGFIGILLLMNEYCSFWSLLMGGLCLIIAFALYREWNKNGELDENPPL
jgi:predicted PurR-regulated permease PerM